MRENGWDSGADEVWHLMYEDIMNKYPDSKFVLPVKDAESWYNSYLHLFHKPKSDYIQVDLMQKSNFTKDSSQGVPYDCKAAHYWGCDFTEEFAPLEETKEACLAGYRAHYERVQQVIPPERLLPFNYSDGYRPLCEFLGKEVPTFP